MGEAGGRAGSPGEKGGAPWGGGGRPRELCGPFWDGVGGGVREACAVLGKEDHVVLEEASCLPPPPSPVQESEFRARRGQGADRILSGAETAELPSEREWWRCEPWRGLLRAPEGEAGCGERGAAGSRVRSAQRPRLLWPDARERRQDSFPTAEGLARCRWWLRPPGRAEPLRFSLAGGLLPAKLRWGKGLFGLCVINSTASLQSAAPDICCIVGCLFEGNGGGGLG